ISLADSLLLHFQLIHISFHSFQSQFVHPIIVIIVYHIFEILRMISAKQNTITVFISINNNWIRSSLFISFNIKRKGIIMKLHIPILLGISALWMIMLSFYMPNHTYAEENNIYQKRLALYKKTAALTQVPWYYLAAMDQYER